jgi:hypothetical protein
LKNPNLSDKEKASLEKNLKIMKKNMQREEAEENIVKESKNPPFIFLFLLGIYNIL